MFEEYKTRFLYKNGIYICVVLFVLLLVGGISKYEYLSPEPNKQVYTINGFDIKFNGQSTMYYFFKSIKNNNGYLCIGTSESTSLDDGNYFDFINADSSLNFKFSKLTGAGRTCGLFMPMLMLNRDVVKDLKIIYFINPVYWRTDLSNPLTVYWSRYSNYDINASTKFEDENEIALFKPVQAYMDILPIKDKFFETVENRIRNLRKPYFEGLRLKLKPEEFIAKHEYVSTNKSLDSYDNFGEIDIEKIDTVWNIRKNFENKGGFKPIDTSTNYRYEELESFVKLCDYLNIDAHFIVGPYNWRFVSEYDPNSIDEYENCINKIKSILQENNSSVIDMSYISYLPGTFIDYQHHSSYGAYLIYKELKQKLNEED
jgi:hypothetical protein